MPWKVFTAASVLTAADVNDYLAEQARPIVTSSTRPSSPPEGMHIVETDTDLTVDYDGSAWVATGQNKTWTTFTPSWTATANPAIGNGTITGRWRYVTYKTVRVAWYIVAGSTTTYGSGPWELSLPSGITAVTTAGTMQFGGARATDQSAPGFTVGTLVCGSAATTVIAYSQGSGSVLSTAWQSNFPMTWANTDIFAASMTIEIA